MRRTRPWWIRARAGCVFGCLLIVLGCGRDEDARFVDDDELAAEFPEQSSRAAPTLSDAEAADIVVTAIATGSRIADLARTRSGNPAVVRFAEVVVTDHAALNAEAQRLRAQLRLGPAEQQHSRELQQAATVARAALDSLDGAVFDRTYILREIEHHRTVLELFERTVIPAVQNSDLRALLENILPTFVAHLQRAEQIRMTLGS